MNHTFFTPQTSIPKKIDSSILWIVGIVFLCYILPGLFTHSPWKTFDALNIGVAIEQYDHGFALFPSLTGQWWLEDGPLMSWIQSAMLRLWPIWPFELIGLIRLPNIFYLSILLFLGYKIGKTYDSDQGRLTLSLLLLGTVGLLLPVHEASSVTFTAMLWMLGYYGMIKSAKNPYLAGILSGLAISGTFLTLGLSAQLIVQMVMPLMMLFESVKNEVSHSFNRGPQKYHYFLSVILFSLLPIGVWLGLAHYYHSNVLAYWWTVQLNPLQNYPIDVHKFLSILKLISWATFPCWPLALYAVVKHRQELWLQRYRFPIILFIVGFISIFFLGRPRLEDSLILGLPLAILALDRITTLPYMVTGLLSWFSALIFTLVIGYFWVTWSAFTFGVPTNYAIHLAKLFPQFQYPSQPVTIVVAALIFIGWFLFILKRPNAHLRDLLNWSAGLALFWAMSMWLGLPLLDHLRSYEGVSLAVAKAVGAEPRQRNSAVGPCVNYLQVASTQRSSLLYYTNINLQSLVEGSECRYLLVQDNPLEQGKRALPEWRLILQVSRPKDRNELYRLYVRKNDTLAPNIE